MPAYNYSYCMKNNNLSILFFLICYLEWYIFIYLVCYFILLYLLLKIFDTYSIIKYKYGKIIY